MSNQPKSGNERSEQAGQQKSGQQKPMQEKAGQRNEGEGNRTAARAFDADEQRFAQDRQKVDRAAQAARQALDSPEAKDLARAEREGLKHIKK